MHLHLHLALGGRWAAECHSVHPAFATDNIQSASFFLKHSIFSARLLLALALALALYALPPPNPPAALTSPAQLIWAVIRSLLCFSARKSVAGSKQVRMRAWSGMDSDELFTGYANQQDANFVYSV